MSDTPPVTPPATPAWMADLPDDLKANPTISTFKGNDWKEVGPVMARSYAELRSKLGGKLYDIPGENATPEQLAAFHRAIGVPETVDKYQAADEALLAKAGIPKEVMAAALAKAHEHGMTPRQVKGFIYDWYLGQTAAGTEAQAKAEKDAADAAQAKITEKYKDKVDAKKQLVKSVLALGGKDFADQIEKAGFGNSPEFFDALVTIGEKFVESQNRGPSGAGGGSGFGASREHALQRIKAIMSERSSDFRIDAKYNDPKSPEFAEWVRLHDAAEGKQS